MDYTPEPVPPCPGALCRVSVPDAAAISSRLLRAANEVSLSLSSVSSRRPPFPAFLRDTQGFLYGADELFMHLAQRFNIHHGTLHLAGRIDGGLFEQFRVAAQHVVGRVGDGLLKRRRVLLTAGIRRCARRRLPGRLSQLRHHS